MSDRSFRIAVATALDKLADVAAELEAGAGAGLDLGRVVLIGHSAGGHLALWLAQAHRQDAVKLLGDAAVRYNSASVF